MTRYLVAIDGSKYSEMALKTAIDLAEKTKASITLLSVIDIDQYLGSTSLQDFTLKSNRDITEKMLAEVIEKYQNQNVKLEKLVTTGSVANEIIAESRNDYDLVIVGSRGLGKVKRTFLGSVSNKVVNQAANSTLVVKNYHKDGFSKILVPLDGSRNSKRALYKATKIAENFSSELLIISVVKEIEDSIFTFDKEREKILQEENIKKSKKILADALESIDSSKFKVSTELIIGSVGESIIEKAEEDEYNLIVMGSRGQNSISRAFMGSVSNEVMHSTRKSVLIVK